MRTIGGFQSLSPGNTLLRAFFYNPATRGYDVPYYTVNPKANFGVDPDLKNPYTDQYILAWEQQANPTLRGKPLGVCAYLHAHGCVIAASIEAKRSGMRVGMTF